MTHGPTGAAAFSGAGPRCILYRWRTSGPPGLKSDGVRKIGGRTALEVMGWIWAQ